MAVLRWIGGLRRRYKSWRWNRLTVEQRAYKLALFEREPWREDYY